MELQIFFSNIDNTILTLSIGFFATYIAVYFSFFNQVDDLYTIKKKSIYNIVDRVKEKEIVEFIDELYQSSKVLVLPAERRGLTFKFTLVGFIVVSILGITSDSINLLLGVQISKNWVLFIYSASLGIVSIVFWFEIQYYREFFKLQKKYGDTTLTNEVTINIT